MIVVQLNGGLGNQMFQYACGRSLAYTKATNLVLDTSIFESGATGSQVTKRTFALDTFSNTHYEINNKIFRSNKLFLSRVFNLLSLKIRGRCIQTKSFFVENKFEYNDLISKTNKSCFLVGYFQSPLYFNNIEHIIREDFQFVLQLNNVNTEWLNKIQSVNSISLHIRRTDFVNNKYHDIHGVCSMEYYIDAVKKIVSMIETPIFFIFSDDIDWVKVNLDLNSQKCYFITGNERDKSHNDMFLMSNCKHNIISNSSFSWWGAWLNDNPQKIVIAPKNWFSNKQLNNQTADLIPDTWVKL